MTVGTGEVVNQVVALASCSSMGMQPQSHFPFLMTLDMAIVPGEREMLPDGVRCHRPWKRKTAAANSHFDGEAPKRTRIHSSLAVRWEEKGVTRTSGTAADWSRGREGGMII